MTRRPPARERILDAASDLIGDVGITGATTRRIAQRAGVNGAQINYYFRTKMALLREASFGLLMRVFEPTVRAMLEGDDVAAGVAAATRMLRSPASDPRMLRISMECMYLGALDPQTRETMVAALREVRRVLGARLAAPGVDGDAMAGVVLAFLDGIGLHLLMDGSLDLERAAAAIETMIRSARRDDLG